ncbi:polysaccharide pyruvyl transferase family protein [Labilibaculum sp.]|uniref:polysaccharide pyruvyl transferase family protein n=1 Tax=Labilibaculum sp. TaxID=2060723 RepID=UPI003569C9C0
MKFGLLTYRKEEKNIGDYIQSIAAKRYLPTVDKYISREGLKLYNDENIAVILNGWFLHDPKQWPPSEKITPFFTSLHITPPAYNSFLSESSIAYMKKFEPIGCRDLVTLNLLKNKGVEAFFSGCLTLTLNKEDFHSGKKHDVILNDILFNWKVSFLLKSEASWFRKLLFLPFYLLRSLYRKYLILKIIPKDIRKRSENATNELKSYQQSDVQKFQIAEEMLEKIANSNLVITSRIHVALPCLAFGTPVVFINNNLNGERFKGIVDLFNCVDIKEYKRSNIDWNNVINKKTYQDLRTKLISRCTDFISNLDDDN